VPHSLNTFDLNLLRVFEAVMLERSVTAAANRLGLSAPAVSNALSRLRMAMDDPLFVKTRHGMEPTPLAHKLDDPVADALSNIRAALSFNLCFDPSSSHRSFSLLMNDLGATSLLPGIVQRLEVEAPHVGLHIISRDHSAYEDALDSGVADLAVGRVRLSKSFCSALVLTSKEIAVMRRDHPGLRRGSDGVPAISMDDYFAASHIDVTAPGVVSNVPESSPGLGNRRRIAFSVPHLGAVDRLLPKTNLIATVPKLCLNIFVNRDKLGWSELPFRMEPDLISMWWHKRQNEDPGHVWLRDMIRSSLLELDW
jgi:DNA-binding transcriptional LysR family regulator